MLNIQCSMSNVEGTPRERRHLGGINAKNIANTSAEANRREHTSNRCDRSRGSADISAA